MRSAAALCVLKMLTHVYDASHRLGKEVGKLLEGLLLESRLMPQVGRQEVIRRLQRRKCRLHSTNIRQL